MDRNRGVQKNQQPRSLSQIKVVIIILIILVAIFLISASDNSGSPEGGFLFGLFKQKNEVEGIVVRHVREFPKKTEYLYYLETGQGQVYEITGDDPKLVSQLNSGAKLKVSQDDLELTSLKTSTQFPKDRGKIYLPGGSLSGTFETLIVLAHFKDLDLACTKDKVRSITLSGSPGSVSEQYFTESKGNVEFFGDVVGPTRLENHPLSEPGCEEELWTSEMDDYVRSVIRLNPDAYDRIIYVLPPKPGCPDVRAESPGRRSWVYTCDTIHNYIRVLGHNFGMHNALNAPDYEGCCGDNTDSMGSSSEPQFNSAHLYQMQWYPPEKIISISSDGQYKIDALDLPLYETTRPTIIKADCNYYLSYKDVPDGVDPNVGTERAYDNKVAIHTYLGGDTETFRHTHLDVGETYYDSNCGQSFTFVSRDPKGATIEVKTGSQPPTECLRNTPILKVTPESEIKQPGDSAGYLVTLTNEDTLDCSPTTFLFDKTLDLGLTGVFSQDSLTLHPGGVDEVVLTITSSLSQPDGTYLIQAHSSSNEGPLHDNTDTSLLIVDGIEPSTVELTASPSQRYIDLYWTAARDNTGVVEYSIYRDGKLIAETTGTSYRDYGVHGRRVIYAYYIVARDEADNEGSSSNVVTSNILTTSLTFGGESVGFYIPQCRDGIDNNKDGFCDYRYWVFAGCKDGSQLGDIDCSHQNDNSE